MNQIKRIKESFEAKIQYEKYYSSITGLDKERFVSMIYFSKDIFTYSNSVLIFMKTGMELLFDCFYVINSLHNFLLNQKKSL